MAKDPLAQRRTVSYEGGSVTATAGLLEYMFGTLSFSWQPGTDTNPVSGRKRWKYGNKQRDNAAGGTEVDVWIPSGQKFRCRVSGDVADFIDQVITKTGDRIVKVTTRRGTVYGPQFAEL